MTPTDLDELDRLRAAASYADKWEYISDFVSVACWMYCHGGSPTMEPADKAWLFTLIEAYPALAGELRELRAEVTRLRELHLMHCGMAACDDRDTTRDIP